MGRLLSTLILIAVIGGAAAFFGAPAMAFFALRSAAQAGDVEALGDLVDFPATRASLAAQLDGSQAEGPAPSILEDPVEAIRRRFEQMRPAPDAEVYLTPQALAGLTRAEGWAASERSRTGQPPQEAATLGAPWPSPAYWGVNRARLAVADEGGSETLFTFERKGPFRWQLVAIALPEGAPPQAAGARPDKADAPT